MLSNSADPVATPLGPSEELLQFFPHGKAWCCLPPSQDQRVELKSLGIKKGK
nr:hypothetical protein [Candidatus Methylacidiphilum infernorum]